ncbi:MAG: hypothetical protein JXA83_09170 [Acidimicrobiales bacterium]|nr:hypothetical protein [Acidimicrobiales bacterium]
MRPIALLLLAAVLLAGCGGDDTADTAGTADAAVTLDTASTDLGTVLVDGDGRTLYLFDSDPEGESACTDACAETWPPVAGPAEATGDADPALVGTITRPDGSTQATYAGHPLYLYAADSAPGDVTGQGVGEVWWVLAPDGAAIHDVAGAGTETSATGVDGPAY